MTPGESLANAGLLPCERTFGVLEGEGLPVLDGTVAVVVTKELTVRGCVLDAAGALVELFCNPLKLMEGVRGEDVSPLPELVGAIPTKLTGTVVVDAGELLTVVGAFTTLFEVELVDVSGDVVLPKEAILPPVKDVAPLAGVCTLTVGTTLEAVGETGVVLTVGTLIPALASAASTWVTIVVPSPCSCVTTGPVDVHCKFV